jgi:small subunit ribosomal protein S16
MSVKIRLRRMGSAHKPFFRIVVADVRSANAGSFLEEIGWYDPAKKADTYKVDVAKADAWIAKGAQPSATVTTLIKRARADAAKAPAPVAEVPAEEAKALAADAEAEAPAEKAEAEAPAEKAEANPPAAE